MPLKFNESIFILNSFMFSTKYHRCFDDFFVELQTYRGSEFRLRRGPLKPALRRCSHRGQWIFAVWKADHSTT